MKQYTFSWSDLGDLATGRPNLGKETSVLVYRLMQFTFKDVFSGVLGLEKTEDLFAAAGRLAGREFCRHVLDTSLPFSDFVADLQEKLIALKIGVLRIEEADMETMRFTLTVAEDLDCSGLPVMGQTVCDYDEGFIAGILGAYTGREFLVKEIDCWASGDRVCRFTVQPAKE